MSLSVVQGNSLVQLLAAQGTALTAETDSGTITFTGLVGSADLDAEFTLGEQRQQRRISVVASAAAVSCVSPGAVLAVNGEQFTVQTVQSRPGSPITRLYAEQRRP